MIPTPRTRIVLRAPWIAVALAAAALLGAGPALAQLKTRNVVLIVSDGLRWQEVFSGADPTLLDEEHGGVWESVDGLRQRFWNDDPALRRRLLLPFLWGTVADRGRLYGNQAAGSIGHVSNGFAFSYPGYNEMITGHADRRIDSNEFGPNPNVNVFEWLNTQPDLAGHVAVFGTWRNYADIFNEARSHLVMQAGAARPVGVGAPGRSQALLDRLIHTTNSLEEGDVLDSFLQVELVDYVKAAKPRALFVGYGETDDWAHSGRYDLVLESAHHMDAFVHELWDTMQAMPEYRDRTTFIITADHGRGSGPVEWKEHGIEQKGSENIWIAVIGPDTTALGEVHGGPEVVQAQIASTIAALLGRDYRSAVPAAAAPLPVLPAH